MNAIVVFERLPVGAALDCSVRIGVEPVQPEENQEKANAPPYLIDVIMDYARSLEPRAANVWMLGEGDSPPRVFLPRLCENVQGTAQSIVNFANERYPEWSYFIAPPSSAERSKYVGLSLREVVSMDLDEFEKRRMALTHPCDPAPWRRLGDYFAATDEGEAEQTKIVDPQGASYYALADVLDGRSVEEASSRWFDRPYRKFIEAVLEIQLDRFGCQI